MEVLVTGNAVARKFGTQQPKCSQQSSAGVITVVRMGEGWSSPFFGVSLLSGRPL